MNEIIVCLGDSITFGYDGVTKSQVDSPYPKVLQELQKDKNVINSGRVGWQSKQILQNIDSLVIDKKPTYCILMLGINDARGSSKGLPLSKRKYLRNMEEIIDILKQNKIKVLLATPTPVRNKRVQYFGEALVKMAIEKNVIVIDTFAGINTLINCNNQTITSALPDGVHLTNDYYKELAYIINDYFTYYFEKK